MRAKLRAREALRTGWSHAKTWSAALAFLGGFGLDLLTIERIDEPFTVGIQAGYLVVAGAILCLSMLERSEWLYTGLRVRRRVAKLFLKYGDFIFHFLLGSLLSAFTIFYFKSSSGLVSGFFLLTLVGFLLLNEQKALQRVGVMFKTILYQLALVSYATFLIPLIVGRIHAGLFAIGVGLSVALTALMGGALLRAGKPIEFIQREFIKPSLAVWCMFVGLYVTHVLPPIPLSVQYVGVYHGVEKVEGSYHLSAEVKPWVMPWSEDVFHARPGEPMYFFTRVFAPSEFQDRVYLRWEHYSSQEKWETTDRIPLNITGGRGLGFRGYAYKQNYALGRWRTFVETDDGREIGRLTFRVEEDGTSADAPRVHPLEVIVQ